MQSTALRRPVPMFGSIALHDLAGVLIGIILPLAAAALYRTYDIAVHPNWLELTRQMGLPFVAGELAVVLWARRCGFEPAALIADMPRRVRAAFLLFVATFWISSAFTSQMWSFSTAITLIWCVHLLFGGAVYHLARRAGPFDSAAFAGWMSAGLALLAIWTTVHFLTPPPTLTVGYGMLGWGSAVPGFISHRLLGAWAGAASVLVLGVLWQQPADRASPSWLYPAFVLTTGVWIWTGTRAAVLAMGVGLLAAVLLAGRPASRDLWWKAALAFMVAAVIAVSLNPYGDPSFLFYRVGTYSSGNEISSGRIEFWLNALRAAMAHPLLGSGAGSCWWLVSAGGFHHVQPHNAVVQFLLSWGVVPTLPCLGLLGWMGWQVHRRARALPSLVPLVLMLDALLAMSLVDGTLYFARFLMLIAMLFAVCLAQTDRARG